MCDGWAVQFIVLPDGCNSSERGCLPIRAPTIGTTLGDLYKKLRSVKRLRKAWSVVYRNGMSSKSQETKAIIEEFSLNAETHLARIAKQLLKSKFRFSPSIGIAVKKPNKPNSKRPLVISPVENRILQRAILDIIQQIPSIRQIQEANFNYGGVNEKGVQLAIYHSYDESIKKPYFIKTDIKAFFVNIPRDKALKIITDQIDDDDFNDILTQATITELDNIASLGSDKSLFPLEDMGVAQGSCLSPLLCNLLLHEFDKKMNSRGVRCIRYIDDFILFASSKSSAIKAFDSAKNDLKKFNLDVYDPRTDKDKAEQGYSKDGFEFLGCHIRPDRIRPADKEVKRLKEKVSEIISKSLLATSDPSKALKERKTYKDALVEISNTIRGWGNSYAFCTDDQLMQNIDSAISEKIDNFNLTYKNRLNKLSKADKKRMMGIFLLQDAKKEDANDPKTLRYVVKHMAK